MKINREAIDGSRPVAPYSAGNIYLTASVNRPVIYAFWLSENEEVILPARIDLPVEGIRRIRSVELLGVKESLKWQFTHGRLTAQIPPSLRQQGILKNSAVFKVTY